MSKRIKPVGLIDCDGPMADLVSPTVELVRRSIPDWKPAPQWEFHGNLPPEVRLQVEGLWRSRGFAASLPPTEGAREHVRELAEHHEIYVVTSPMDDAETWTHDRNQWLAEHFGIDKHHVIHAKSKHLIYGSYLIDDKVANLRAWGSQWVGGARRALLWKMFHNQDHHQRLGADSWPEMLRLALEVAQRESN